MSVPRTFALAAVLAVLAAMAVAALLAREDAPYEDLSPEEAARLMRDTPGLMVLDVRSPGEQSQGMIPGAIPTTPGQVAAGSMNLPAGRPILVYCRNGHRSSNAARDLAARGHTEIYNLSGGLRAWSAEGLPLVPPGNPAGANRSAP